MSGLKFMAEETGTSYDSLVTGLTRFASTVVKAGEGSEQQTKAFARLGISQEQVKALLLGSEGIKEFEREAAKLGLTVGEKDVVEVEKFRLTTKATEAQMQSILNEIGKFVLPAFENFKIGVLVTAIALKDLPHALHGDYRADLEGEG